MQNTIDLKNRHASELEKPRLEKKSFSWTAHEFTPRERSREWLWSVGIIGAGASIFSLIVGNFLFAIFLVLALFLFFVYELRGPREHEFGITPRGVKVQNRLFEFPHLDSFWIFEHENGDTEVSILSHKTFVPHIKMPLGSTDPELVRALLIQYLPEKHQEESLIDILARRFGL